MFGADVGFFNPYFCYAVAYLIQGLTASYGYIRMFGNNKPETRATFAKCYWYGDLIGMGTYAACLFIFIAHIKSIVPAHDRVV